MTWGAEIPRWFDVMPKKTSAWGVIHEQAHCDEAANHQWPIAAAFWIIHIVSMEEFSSLMQNLVQICCCIGSHFECDSYLVYMLTQWHLPPPLTSTVKSSLFIHVHSSPLSLAARLHWCCANCSCYVNRVAGLFPGQISYSLISWVSFIFLSSPPLPIKIHVSVQTIFP